MSGHTPREPSTDGRVVHEIPKPRRWTRTNIDWDAMAALAKLTRKPVLAAENETESQVKSLRLRKRPPFITDEGRIVVNLRNSTLENGVRRGDIYFTWHPTTPTEESK